MLSCHWTHSDSISKIIDSKGRGLIFYTHTLRSQLMPFFTSQLTPPFFLLSLTVTRGCDWPVRRLVWSNAIAKIGQSHYIISNTTTSCNPHHLRNSEGSSGHAKSLSGLCIKRVEDVVGGGEVGASKGEGKDHVVKSMLSSSFILFFFGLCNNQSVEAGFLCVRDLKYPFCNMVPTDMPKLQLWFCVLALIFCDFWLPTSTELAWKAVSHIWM